MRRRITVLVIVPDLQRGATISQWIVQLGYQIFDLLIKGESIPRTFHQGLPDLVCIYDLDDGDLQSLGYKDWLIKYTQIPKIHMIDSPDRNIEQTPADSNKLYVPYGKRDLREGIRRSLEMLDARLEPPDAAMVENTPEILGDRIFVRHKDQLIKLYLEDILYVEADRNYARIITKSADHMLAVTLKVLSGKLPPSHFVRVHRSFIVNIVHIDAVSEGHLVIQRKVIPIGRSYRTKLMQRIRTV